MWFYRRYQITPPVVSGRFVGHVPLCTKFSFMKNFVGQVKPREGGSNLTPTVSDGIITPQVLLCVLFF